MGIKDAFDTGKADFSPMAAVPLFIADVIHAANIDVDENGTEAAAATAVMMAPTSMPMAPKSEPILFTADRPFVFIISHTTSGEVLFAGIVNNPAAKD
jgi:serpin B